MRFCACSAVQQQISTVTEKRFFSSFIACSVLFEENTYRSKNKATGVITFLCEPVKKLACLSLVLANWMNLLKKKNKWLF